MGRRPVRDANTEEMTARQTDGTGSVPLHPEVAAQVDFNRSIDQIRQ